jgi:hypothetical protein
MCAMHDAEQKRLNAPPDGREIFLGRIAAILRRTNLPEAEELIREAEIQTLRGNPDRVACVGHPPCALGNVELLCPRGLALIRRGLT